MLFVLKKIILVKKIDAYQQITYAGDSMNND